MLIPAVFVALAGLQPTTVDVPLSLCSVNDLMQKAFASNTVLVADPGVRLDRYVLARFTGTPVAAARAALEKALDVRFVEDGQVVKVKADAATRKMENACRNFILKDFALQLKQREAAWNEALKRGKGAYRAPVDDDVRSWRIYGAAGIVEPRSRLAAELALAARRKPNFLESLFNSGQVVTFIAPRDLPETAIDFYRADVPTDPDLAAVGPVSVSHVLAIKQNWIALRLRVYWHRANGTPIWIETGNSLALYPPQPVGKSSLPPLVSTLIEGYPGNPTWGAGKEPPPEFADFVKQTDAASKAFAEREDARVQFHPLIKQGCDSLSQIAEAWAAGNKADLLMPLDPVFEALPGLEPALPARNPKFCDLFGGKQAWWASDVQGIAVFKNRLSFVSAGRRFPTAALAEAAKALAKERPYEEWEDEGTLYTTMHESVWSAFVEHLGADDLGMLVSSGMAGYRGLPVRDLAHGAATYIIWPKLSSAQKAVVLNLEPKDGHAIPISDVAGISAGQIGSLMRTSEEVITPHIAGFDRFLAGKAIGSGARKVKGGSLVNLYFYLRSDAGIYALGNTYRCEFFVRSRE